MSHLQNHCVKSPYFRLIGVDAIPAAMILSVWCLFAVFLYVFFFFSLPHILHPEFILDASNFLSGEVGGIKDFIEKTFNLRMIEDGMYRPRWMAFAIQYVDFRVWVYLNSIGIPLGGRNLFAFINIPLLLFGGYSLCKRLFPKMPIYMIVAISCVFLYVPQYVAGSFLLLRSAKLIAPAIGLLVISFFLKERENAWKGKYVLGTFIASLFMTIDEQLLGVVAVMFGFAVLHIFKDGRYKGNAILTGMILSFYALYHCTYGKYLFEHFTPGKISTHVHDFSNLLALSPHIDVGIRCWITSLRHFALDNEIVLWGEAFLWVGIIGCCLRRSFFHGLIGIFFLFSSLAFSIIIVAMHPAVGGLPELPGGFYYICSMYLVLVAIFYMIAQLPITSNIVLLQKVHVGLLLLVIAYITAVQVNFRAYTMQHGTLNGSFFYYAGQVSDFLNSDVARNNGITARFFSRVLTSPEEYQIYLSHFENPNTYVLGETVLFDGTSKDGHQYFLYGLSATENDFVWTDGKEALLRFKITEAITKDLFLSLSVRTVFYRPQRLIVSCGKEVVFDKTLSVKPQTIQIPISKDCISWRGVVEMTFYFPDAITPVSVKVNADTRELAFAFTSFSISAMEGSDLP